MTAIDDLYAAAHALVVEWNRGEDAGGEHDLDRLDTLIRNLDTALFVAQTRES